VLSDLGGRKRRPHGRPEDRGHLVEGHGEKVVEHESEAFGGAEGIEHEQ
jgi:hypothetical protein